MSVVVSKAAKKHHRKKLGSITLPCPVCGVERRFKLSQTRQANFRAMHAVCYRKSRRRVDDEQVGAYGSVMHHGISDPDNPAKRAITCGWCHEIWYAEPQSKEQRKKYAWVCPKCWPRQLTHEQLLPRGTKVLFHTRAPNDCHKVAIQCRGCFDATKELKYVQHQSIDRYIKGLIGVLALLQWAGRGDATLWAGVWRHIKLLQFWDELCGDCTAARGSLARNTEDKKSLLSDTVTLFSQEKNGMVPVLAETCQCVWWTTRVNAVNNWHIYIDVCPSHQRNPRALAALLKERAAGSAGNGQGAGSAKRPIGRPLNSRRADPKLTAINVQREVLRLKAEGLSRSQVTANMVASILNIGGITGGDTMMRRIKKGVDIAWDDLKDFIWDGGNVEQLEFN